MVLTATRTENKVLIELPPQLASTCRHCVSPLKSKPSEQQGHPDTERAKLVETSVLALKLSMEKHWLTATAEVQVLTVRAVADRYRLQQAPVDDSLSPHRPSPMR